MTGLRFLFRVTLRRLDLATEISHIKEPQKMPLIMNPCETRRLLAVARTLKIRVLLALGYGCGLRASEVIHLRVGDIDSAQSIIRVVQAKGRKDRNVMLSPEVLALLRQWWKARPRWYDVGVPPEQRWLFPGRRPGRPMTTRNVPQHDPPNTGGAGLFRDHGAMWRAANVGHVNIDQMKVMSAIERGRTAALGGHVARCENEACAHTLIAYNSCRRNRHCPKCQGAAARQWLAEREAELLPVGYFHLVFVNRPAPDMSTGAES